MACPCPDGYTLLPDGSGCQIIEVSSPICMPTTYTVCKAVEITQYGYGGAYFYETSDLRPLPIITIPTVSKLIDNADNELLVLNTLSDGLWGDSGTSGLSDGRLNVAGIWACPAGSYDPINEWIGFSVCITVPTTTTYCIGIGADNAVRFKVNGVITVQLGIPQCVSIPPPLPGDPCSAIGQDSITNQHNFTIWHVIPITLNAGTTVITLEGYNDSAQAAFGAEIYKGTITDVMAFTAADFLDSTKTIFSTLNQIGLPFQTGTNSGCHCASGAFADCSGTPQCLNINTVLCPNCFLLTDCNNSTHTIVIYADPSFNLGANIGNVITINDTEHGEFNNTCWVISSTPCINGAIKVFPPSTVTIFTPTLSQTACQACEPPVCYQLVDCAGILPNIIVQEDLSTYVGEVITISIYGTTCWQVELTNSCTGFVKFGSIPVITVFTNCLACNPICYLLTDCAPAPGPTPGPPVMCVPGPDPGPGPKPPINLTNYHPPITVCSDLSAYVGQVIQISTMTRPDCSPICWTVTIAPTCLNCITIDPIAIITAFADCCHCLNKQCYILTLCVDQVFTPSTIFTQTDLSAYIGKTINTVAYSPVPFPGIPPNLCWTVSTPGSCPCPIVATQITFNNKAYDDCVCCNPPAPIPEPLPLRVIPDPVHIYTKDDISPCEEETEIRFAQTFWNMTKKLKFGISTCHWDKDFDEIWIKKQLIELHKSRDPLYCIEPEHHCHTCNPDPCSCHQDPCRCRWNPCSCEHKHHESSRCGPCGHTKVGQPCREEEEHHHYLLWTDGGILLWNYPDSKFLYK